MLTKTERAVLIRVHGENIWLPKSQMFDLDELPEEGEARVKMSAWIAKEKGLR